MISLFFIFIVNLLSYWFINFLDFLFKNKLLFHWHFPHCFSIFNPIDFSTFYTYIFMCDFFLVAFGLFVFIWQKLNKCVVWCGRSWGFSFYCSLRSLNLCSDFWHYFIDYYLHTTTFQTKSVSFSAFKLVPVGMVYLLHCIC